MLTENDILYQDNYILAIHKPAGLMVEPDKFGNPNAVELALKLLAYKPKMKGGLGVVHRLDRPVEGVLIFALRPAALKNLQLQIQQKTVTKTYTALLEGEIEGESGNWIWPLGRSADRKSATEDHTAAGKPAKTHWRVIERKSDCTLVELNITTGRFHQIRKHAALSGHPIAGDVQYGSKQKMDSICLQSSSYEFSHPKHGDRIRIEAKPAKFIMNFDEEK